MAVTARNLLVVPFALTRVPLYLFDRQVVARLPARSGPRTALDSGLGVLDVWAGRVLGDEEIGHHGRARLAAARPQRQALESQTHTDEILQAPTQLTRKHYARTRPADS